jgi:flavin reductase (DIM6/NTAB) family NADH-FMN oxidoreductase RutF
MSTPFDDLVARMDAAMIVVTVAVDGERDGCLVGFHSQASIEPPRYAVWLSKANRTCTIARHAHHLAVHVLGEDQHALAELFGGETGDEVDKLAAVSWEPGPGGVPLLTECPNRFVGRVIESAEGTGDHILWILDPTDATAADSPPPLRLSAAVGIEPGHPA